MAYPSQQPTLARGVRVKYAYFSNLDADILGKLLLAAEKFWRAFNAPRLMRNVYDGKLFTDGIAVRAMIKPTRRAD